MTAAARTAEPFDPDLEQAIIDLQFVARKLRQVEGQIASNGEQPSGYRNLAAQLSERGELRSQILARAERLAIVPSDGPLGARALLLMIEESWRLRGQSRRAPKTATFKAALAYAGEVAERDRIELEADVIAAQHRGTLARARAAAASAALAYIEASA